MIVTDSGGSTFELCPAGSYLAKCCKLIDIGTQTSTFDGQTKTARKALIAWEILDADCRRTDGQPFVLSKRFTQSLHEMAALRKTLVSWRGRDFTPTELQGFDLRNVLGQNAFLSVIHNEKDGRTYANIAGVMKLPKRVAADVPSSEPLTHFDLSEPDWTVFAQLPSRVQGQIELSPEYKNLPNKPASISLPAAPAPTRTTTPASTPRPIAPAAPKPAPKPQPQAAVGSGFDDMDDDIPF